MSSFLPTTLTTSPHVKHRTSVEMIMRHVIYALLPLVLFSIYIFGWSAFLVLTTTTLFAVGTEFIYCRFTKRESSLHDNSAALTGLLLGLTLPPALPLWMAAVGSIVSILLGKMIFGGLGNNPFNPALVGRAFLQTAFPTAITTWSDILQSNRFSELPSSTFTAPFCKPIVDAVTGATPLSAFKFEHISTPMSDLFLGQVPGSVGETSSLLILLGGLYLLWKRYFNWRIPVGIMGTVFLLTSILHLFGSQFPNPMLSLFSGGLLLGAVFMATDLVTSPLTQLAVWVYAIFIGVLVVVIRIWGGLPEGVMYAILLGNAIVPLLGRFLRPRAYGTRGLS